jgi:hypothetical protein
MQDDAMEHVKKCDKCQQHASITHIPPEDLYNLYSPWTFHTWGMDILGPFHKAPGQLKFFIVAVDYFTKLIEAEPLATITSARIHAFTFKTIICRFNIPAEIVIDNDTQFTDKHFWELLEGLQI